MGRLFSVFRPASILENSLPSVHLWRDHPLRNVTLQPTHILPLANFPLRSDSWKSRVSSGCACKVVPRPQHCYNACIAVKATTSFSFMVLCGCRRCQVFRHGLCLIVRVMLNFMFLCSRRRCHVDRQQQCWIVRVKSNSRSMLTTNLEKL